MNQFVKQSKAFSYVMIMIAIFIFLCIWPFGVINKTTISKSDEVIVKESDPVSVENNITQMFVAEGGELSAVDLYVCNEMIGETITFRLYDASYKELFNTFYVVKNNQKTPGFIHIPVGYDLEKDQEYFYTIEGLSADLTVALEDHEASTSIVNGLMSYGGNEVSGYNVIIRYEYTAPFVWWQAILLGFLIAIITVLLLISIKTLFVKKLEDKEIKVQKVFQFACNPLIAIGTIVSLLSIYPGKKFGTGVINYLCWGTGVILLALLLLFLVNYKRSYTKPLINMDYIKNHFSSWLQIIAIATMIWYCFEYMNGLYDIHHAYATRKILICFFFVIITTYSRKELLNIFNLIWLFGGGIFGYFYAKPYFGLPEQDGLYKLSAGVILVGGFVILNMIITIVQIIRKKISAAKLNLLFAIPFIIFMVAIVVLSNTRQWPGFLATLCFFLIFRMAFWNKRDTFTENLCMGIILNFVMMVIFSLEHRPYYYYIYHRYNMSYYTVTMTATHLTLVAGAAFVRLFAKSRKVEDKKQLIPELIIFGMVSCYQIFTLSRTGYLATGAMIFLALVVIAILFDEKKKRFGLFFKRIGVMLIAILYMFPITFTATRILPAVSNDPVIYEFEPCIVTMYKGTPTDCQYYMDISRFIAVFRSKVLGVGEDVTGKNDIQVLPKKNVYLATAFEDNLYNLIGSNMVMASNNVDEIEDIEERNEDVSNGRMDIYSAYMKEWNLWGHDDMGVLLQDGSMATHAHSIYFQVIQDHGLIFGIYFILFMGITLILSIKRMKELKNKDAYQMLLPTILVGFLVAGIVEWIFHPCNPYGLSVFVAMVPLFFKVCGEKKEQ